MRYDLLELNSKYRDITGKDVELAYRATARYSIPGGNGVKTELHSKWECRL